MKKWKLEILSKKGGSYKTIVDATEYAAINRALLSGLPFMLERDSTITWFMLHDIINVIFTPVP